MPYHITWESRGVYRAYAGEVTDAERRESLERICGDRRFDNLRYAITDFLAVERLVEAPQATLELAALNIAPLMTNRQLVLAAVAVDPEHLGYIERLKRHGFVKAPYESFATVAQARQWIERHTAISIAAPWPPPRGEA